jgi:hypothetical protein
MIYKEISIITLGVSVMKLFSLSLTLLANKLECFLSSLKKTELIFASKATSHGCLLTTIKLG